MVAEDSRTRTANQGSCYADPFGFTGFLDEEPGSTLFPGPPPARLVSTIFFGGAWTASLLQSGRTSASTVRDFYNRLNTWVLLSGHKLYAVRPVFHGHWSSRQLASCLDALRAVLVADRIQVVEECIRDDSMPVHTLSALVWALQGEGAPLGEAEAGDKVIVAADVPVEDAKHPPVYANWGERVSRLWSEKYPNRKGVVRAAMPVMGLDLGTLRAAVSGLSRGLELDAERKSIDKVRGGAGVVAVVSPHFAAATARRLVHLRKAATVVIAGTLEAREGTR